MERILERASALAEEAEVFSVTLKETPVGFETNRLKMLETRERTTVSLRVIKNGKIGFATTTRPDDVEKLVAMALETAQFGAAARFSLPPAQTYPQTEVYDLEVESVSIEKMVELGDNLISQVRRHTPELVCQAEVTKNIGEVKVINSRGGQASYQKSLFAVAIEGTLVRDTDMLFVGEFESSCRPATDFRPLADSVIQQLELARRTASVATGQLPVIFTPRGVRSAFVTPLAIAFNGKMVVQGASPLVGKQGVRLFDPRLSVWDDAIIAYRLASRPCDDEAMPSQRTALLEGGVVANFLYDLQTAAIAGTRSTGSASRVRGGMPAPSTSAIIIKEGETAFADMVRGMKEGLVVYDLIGAEQGNVLGGEFSGNVLLGYKVERGEIVGRVKNTMVSGNIFDALKELGPIGAEAKWVGGTLRTPAICCSRLGVASKG